jgi:Na+-driven multidrug efflux pump
MTLVAVLGARLFSSIFTGDNQELLNLTAHGMRINAFGFLICGFNIFGSAFFTALGCGGVSLLISFSRTLVFQAFSVLVLPKLFGLGIDGIWGAVILAEGLSLILTLGMFVIRKHKYHYI